MNRLMKFGLLAAALFSGNALAVPIYSNLPATLPPSLPSLGYQATSTTEFGDHIQFAAGPRKLDSVTITMVDWAMASTYGSSAPGYQHNLTFNIYNYVNDTVAGPLIATTTQSAFIPWRPEADTTGTCLSGTWLASNGNCYNGSAFNVVFDFSGQNVIMPNGIVFGLSYNTQSYGSTPIGQPGPYNSLNYGLVATAPSVGTDVNPDSVFWNTSYPGFLTTGTPGTFGADTGWTGYAPAARFDAVTVPEPSSLGLFGIGLAGLAGLGATRRRKQAR